MERQGVVPNAITYNALLSAYEKGNEPKRALDVCAVMNQQGIVPTTITYSTLVSSCDKSKQ